MIPRRAFLASGCALILPQPLWAADARLTIDGSREQAGLMVGTAKGAVVTIDGKAVKVSAEGYFAFGLGYDQTKPTTVVATFPDKTVEKQSIVPTARKYDIQEVKGLPQKYVTPPKDVLDRIARENKQVAEVRTHDTNGTDFVQPFGWPTTGILSGSFGSQRIDNGKKMAPHFGVDIATAEGTPIHAPADAIVTLAAADFYLTGGTTILDHGHGVSTTYLHQSELKVAVGDVVKRGTLIGLVGMKGRATGPHLHWAMNWFQVRLDPSLSTATPTPLKG